LSDDSPIAGYVVEAVEEDGGGKDPFEASPVMLVGSDGTVGERRPYWIY